MSLKSIHLRKILQIMYASERKRRRLLLDDIRADNQRQTGMASKGGDFFSPFWRDAKLHALEKADLRALTNVRIESNEGRKRLYLRLTNSHLTWWEEKRRWRNEPFKLMPQNVKGEFAVPEVGGTIKVENILALNVGDQFNRIIYPYFCEEPLLSDDAARLGLWIMHQALKPHRLEDLRILDILRSRSFGSVDVRMEGGERESFLEKYRVVLKEWNKLKKP